MQTRSRDLYSEYGTFCSTVRPQVPRVRVLLSLSKSDSPSNYVPTLGHISESFPSDPSILVIILPQKHHRSEDYLLKNSQVKLFENERIQAKASSYNPSFW